MYNCIIFSQITQTVYFYDRLLKIQTPKHKLIQKRLVVSFPSNIYGKGARQNLQNLFHNRLVQKNLSNFSQLVKFLLL